MLNKYGRRNRPSLLLGFGAAIIASPLLFKTPLPAHAELTQELAVPVPAGPTPLQVDGRRFKTPMGIEGLETQRSNSREALPEYPCFA